MSVHTLLVIFFIFCCTFLVLWVTFNGIDKTIANQDIMLCESAKISGNVQYLQKCECYYQGESIKCLQK